MTMPEGLQDELREQLMKLFSGPSFQPVDLSEKVEGAPNHIKNYLDMYTYGLNEIVGFHAQKLRVESVEPVVSAQDALNRFALSGMTIEELAGMLAAAVDRLSRLTLTGCYLPSNDKEANKEAN